MKINSIIKQRYKVVKKIADGGMSEVFLCEDLLLKTNWAGKCIQKKSPASLLAYEYLKKETELLVKLKHPRIPMIIDCFDTEEDYIVIMDFIKGTSLSTYVMHHEVGEEEIQHWLFEILNILHYLHIELASPVIFRDLKPENILLDENGELQLIDFGIALETQNGVASSSPCFGTKGYASKEQSQPGWMDCRSDIYAVGAVLYFLYTKQVYANQKLPSVKLKAIMGKCLQEDPNDRYQTVDEILQKLPPTKRPRFHRVFLILGICFIGLSFYSTFQVDTLKQLQYQKYIENKEYEQAMQYQPSRKEAYIYFYDECKQQSIPEALQKMENISIQAIPSAYQDELYLEFAFDCMKLETSDYYRQASFYLQQVTHRDVTVYIQLCDFLSTHDALTFGHLETMETLLETLEHEADTSKYQTYRLQIYSMLNNLYKLHAQELGIQVYETILKISDKALMCGELQEGISWKDEFYEAKLLAYYHQAMAYHAQSQNSIALELYQTTLNEYEKYQKEGYQPSTYVKEKIIMIQESTKPGSVK